MAKSLRASRNKANKSLLRARVHAPVEDARLERLSAKLHELANKPKEDTKDLDTDMIEDPAAQIASVMAEETSPGPEAQKMDLDRKSSGSAKSKTGSSSSKVQKKRKEKLVFAVGKQHGKKFSNKRYRGPGIS